MITNIQDFIKDNYPRIKIISATEVENPIVDKDNFSELKFYDVTFEYKGKKVIKLFHNRDRQTVKEQIEDALKMSKINYGSP